MAELQITKNRKARKYSVKTQLMRVAWAFGRILFRLIPRPLYGPRRLLLKMFGAKVGRQANISNTATIYFPWNLEIGDWSAIGEQAYIYNLGPIVIGERATVSQRAHLCAGSHDYEDPTLPLLCSPIHVGNETWICADAFIGPNITVGNGAVVGACAVVTNNVEPWAVVAGNPAKFVKERKLLNNT